VPPGRARVRGRGALSPSTTAPLPRRGVGKASARFRLQGLCAVRAGESIFARTQDHPKRRETAALNRLHWGATRPLEQGWNRQLHGGGIPRRLSARKQFQPVADGAGCQDQVEPDALMPDPTVNHGALKSTDTPADGPQLDRSAEVD
jgi:hypothetical protein